MKLCESMKLSKSIEISKSVKIPGIGMTSFTLLSMHVIWKGKGKALPISIILADLEINLDDNSGAKQHKLYYMCFSLRPRYVFKRDFDPFWA